MQDERNAPKPDRDSSNLDDLFLSPADVGHQSATAPVDKELVATVILSLGFVGALLLFVHESFLHPSAATQLLPLIFGPIGTAIIGLMNRRQVKQIAAATTKQIEDSKSDPRPSGP